MLYSSQLPVVTLQSRQRINLRSQHRRRPRHQGPADPLRRRCQSWRASWAISAKKKERDAALHEVATSKEEMNKAIESNAACEARIQILSQNAQNFEKRSAGRNSNSILHKDLDHNAYPKNGGYS